MSKTCRFRFLFIVVFAAWIGSPPRASAVTAANSFRPVNTDELKMTSEPAAPGAPAIILYRQVERNDDIHTGHENDYFRIKILTEEGRKYADVEIPFDPTGGKVVDIRARTIRPDGSIANFDGKVFTKTVAKGRGLKYLAKTFTLSDVQVGSIIEYYYTVDLQEYELFDSNWILSDELFTKNAKFTVKPWVDRDGHYYIRWTVINLPPGMAPPKELADMTIEMDPSNIPAFPTEDFMPPPSELKARVDFEYADKSPQTPAQFWSEVGKKRNGQLESFLGQRKALEDVVAGIVSPNDPPEVKVEKIYARVQSLRNTSYEVEKTEEETERTKEKPAANVEEVWKRGYGNGRDLTWLFLGMVRAAGIEAYGVWVADRSRYFFNPNAEQSYRLNSNVVLVKLNGNDKWCDPGAAFTPFGLIPWQETGVQGMQLDKKGYTWVQSLIPTAVQARTERHADFTLSETGDLEGKVTVTYGGFEGAKFRVEERNADDAERKTYLENELKEVIPAACEVKLTNQPEWKDSSKPLVAEFNAKIPGWTSGAGRHALLPVGLFGAGQKHVFDSESRVHPIYVDFPAQEADDISIAVPNGWKISSLPPGWNDTGHVVSFTLAAKADQSKIHISREMTLDFIMMDSKYYTALRNYFQKIKAADEQQVVLDTPGTAAAN
jgi:hypothetical protein